MSKQQRSRFVPWIAGLAGLALVALVAFTAIPGLAAGQVNKLYTIDVRGPGQSFGVVKSIAPSGDQTFQVRLTNSTPGNSNFQSAIINTPTLVDNKGISIKTAVVNRPLSNNGNQNGANPNATISWLDTTNNNAPTCTKPAASSTCPAVGIPMVAGSLYVQNIDPVKSANNLHQFITLDVTLRIPSLSSCSGADAAPAWNATPINGNSLSGDTFAQFGASGTTTAVDPKCGSITLTKYDDANSNNTRDTGENVLTDGWQFTIYDSSNTSVKTVTTDNTGSASFQLPSGTYQACETDPRIDPNSPSYDPSNPWTPSPPGACITVTPSSTSTPNAYNFGNAQGNLGCDPENNTLSTAGPNGDVVLTRGENVTGPCHLKPATLTLSGFNPGDPGDPTVNFDVTGTDQATYTFSIPWPSVANTNPPPAQTDFVEINGVESPLQWCDASTGGNNNGPVLPAGQKACIVQQLWQIKDSTHIFRTDTIYAEVDIGFRTK